MTKTLDRRSNRGICLMNIYDHDAKYVLHSSESLTTRCADVNTCTIVSPSLARGSSKNERGQQERTFKKVNLERIRRQKNIKTDSSRVYTTGPFVPKFWMNYLITLTPHV